MYIDTCERGVYICVHVEMCIIWHDMHIENVRCIQNIKSEYREYISNMHHVSIGIDDIQKIGPSPASANTSVSCSRSRLATSKVATVNDMSARIVRGLVLHSVVFKRVLDRGAGP